jgi:hypothetical protein
LARAGPAAYGRRERPEVKAALVPEDSAELVRLLANLLDQIMGKPKRSFEGVIDLKGDHPPLDPDDLLRDLDHVRSLRSLTYIRGAVIS